jgi:predicted nucleic acid-binding protein
MATTPSSSPPAVVVDANVLIAICAKEASTYTAALAQMRQYALDGCLVYAPGVVVAEALYALCRKLQNGIVTPTQHGRAIHRLLVGVAGILPPPSGDLALTHRAEQIRGTYGCSRSADGIYIALAEQLAQTGPAELVTFDTGMQQQAEVAAPGVTIRLLIAP